MIYGCQQTMARSCGSVGLTVALIELGLIDPPRINDYTIRTIAEGTVYPLVRRNVNDYSTPARMAVYARGRGARTSIMESLPRTILTIVLSKGSVISDWWNYYYKELWTQGGVLGEWRYLIGLSRTDIDNGERALVVAGIHPLDGGGLHYLLFRRHNNNYYVMDPAFGDNDRVNNNDMDDFLSVRGAFRRFRAGRRRYIYMGIALWLNT